MCFSDVQVSMTKTFSYSDFKHFSFCFKYCRFCYIIQMMCKAIVEFFRSLSQNSSQPTNKNKDKPSVKSVNENTRKQFYDDMETGVMDDDF